MGVCQGGGVGLGKYWAGASCDGEDECFVAGGERYEGFVEGVGGDGSKLFTERHYGQLVVKYTEDFGGEVEEFFVAYCPVLGGVDVPAVGAVRGCNEGLWSDHRDLFSLSRYAPSRSLI